MSTCDNNGASPRAHKTKIARRRFLKWMTATAGMTVVSRLGLTFHDEQAVSAAPAQLRNLPDRYQDYPQPSYIPADFTLVAVEASRPDGFGGGESELAYWYLNRTHPIGYRNPLAIYITDQSARPLVAGRLGEPILLSQVSGEALEATYHDGFWVLSGERVLSWESSNVHSITYSHGPYTVGVRGARLVNVTYDELVRIASAITVQTT